MKPMNLFSWKQILKDTYVFTENYLPGQRCVCGVIVGAERILVIDAGLGMGGDLRRYIESVVGTGKPMFLICTHGHTDTIGGAALFDEAYLKHEDLPMVKDSLDEDFVLNQMKGWTNDIPALNEQAKLMRQDLSKVQFKDLHEGDHFHLGGVHVGIMCIPGHTEGSIAVRVTREGVQTTTFVGDAFSAGMNHLHRMDRSQLLDYRDRLNDFIGKLYHDEPLYSSHLPVEVGISTGYDVAKACEEVALGLGTEYDAPFDFGWGKKENGPDLRVHFVNNNYIVYNRDLM